MKTIITNIQRFSLDDGPGIRTTVFFKGCVLHCPWCANPETISKNIEYYYDKDKCIKDNSNCIINSDCCVLKGKYDSESLKNSSKQCKVDAIKIYGKEISDIELYNEILKDNAFYGKDGGVTFSGGEPLLSLSNLESLLIKLKAKDINIAVETSLFVPIDMLKLAIKYVDYFIVDCKILDSSSTLNILGGNIKVYLENLDYLFKNFEHKNIRIRIPIINNYTDNSNNLIAIVELLKKYKPDLIEIFSGHTLAEKKYDSLNKKILKN